MKDKIVERCKKALLKQLHPMIYQENTYPVEAVSKATILSLDKLVESDIAQIYSVWEEVKTITEILWAECNKKSDLLDKAIFNDGVSVETINHIFAEAAIMIKSKLTRPTVTLTDEKIHDLYYRHFANVDPTSGAIKRAFMELMIELGYTKQSCH